MILKVVFKKMNSFKDRLNQAINKSGMSKAELARRSGIGRNSITDYVKGKYEAKQDKAYQLAKALNVDPAWLLGYNVPSNKNEKLIDLYNKLTKERQDRVINYATDQLNQQENNVVSLPDSQLRENDAPTTEIELFGYVSAGTGEWLDEGAKKERIMYYGHAPEYDYALKVNGDSMQPLFENGQIIFVRNASECMHNGQIIIATLNGSAFVKKIDISEDGVHLVSLNPKYEPIAVHDYDDFAVRGIVVL
ncbi:phage repressor [Loigolactobacillus bifermentans DSM 20003]|uniref:Phage repressor n=2 Tax=Loigolactobacillus bifermentans TaxID=1607 RepID=A0A0R1H5X4_9LACO|nr:phage repressor [Loigolactobacillus bifermentans DSM 20003]